MRPRSRRPLHRPLLGLLGALAGSLGLAANAAELRTVVIGTGPVAGTYFPAAGAVCANVDDERERNSLRCAVQATDGSAENLARLRRGELDFALVQSDWQYLAVEGRDAEDGERWEELRAVFSLQAQPMTVVVAADSGIATLEDLKGRRINLGPEGSAIRAVGEALLGALGWTEGDFEEIGALDLQQQVDAICEGELDAFLLPVSHPSGAIAAATDGCGARLVDVAGPAVDKLIEEWPFYAPAEIPGGLYRANAAPVQTYGLRATLVTTTAVPDEVVYEVVRATFARLDALRARHPALAELDPSEMVGAGNTAQLHGGALRYYQEQGWK